MGGKTRLRTSVAEATLPVTEKANGAAGRSTRRATASAARSMTPQPAGDTRPVQRKPGAVEVPVQSMGFPRTSLGAVQRGKGSSSIPGSPAQPQPRKSNARPAQPVASGVVAPPMVRRNRPSAASRDQLSYSSSAMPGRSVSPLDGSRGRGALVSRMGSQPVPRTSSFANDSLPTSPHGSPNVLSRGQSFATNSPPGSPMPTRSTGRMRHTPAPAVASSHTHASSSSQAPPPQSIRVPSYVPPTSPLQSGSFVPSPPPQPAWSPSYGSPPPQLPTAFVPGLASPFSASCPNIPHAPPAPPSPPPSPYGSQSQVAGYGLQPPPIPGSGIFPGPATDPNFLRQSLNVHAPAPMWGPPSLVPVPLRPPPGSMNVPAPPPSAVGTPLAMQPRSGSFTAAEDHALIGHGLKWAPVRGEARGNLGADYPGASTPSASERFRSALERPGLAAPVLQSGSMASVNHIAGISSPVLHSNYAYPSSPPSGPLQGLRHHDVSAPPSPPPAGSRSPTRTGRYSSQQLPPPPPLPRSPNGKRAPEPGWAPVVETHKEPPRAIHPSAGETKRIASPQLQPPRIPRVGESMVCSSPVLPGAAMTNPNLQATNPNLKEGTSMIIDEQHRYPQSAVEKEATWLRPPFGTQHQVSKLPG